MAVKLNVQQFEKYQRLKKWNELETARRMGISKQTLWRAKLPENDPDHIGPSAKFISAALRAFHPLKFDDLFFVDELRTWNETTSKKVSKMESALEGGEAS